MAASEAQQQLEELHGTINGDLEKTRRELSELDTLLRQTTAEVEKLAQRELTVANRLRDLEVNLDKYSKADIKNFYTSAQEVQMRLLMMRGQLEQLLINLVRNAVDAALETGGSVRAGWRKKSNYLEVWVEDDGPGLPNTTNLFVPFFTTKPQGSGIGLVLSRQIAEAHGGMLTLQNRNNARGCEARLRLPL